MTRFVKYGVIVSLGLLVVLGGSVQMSLLKATPASAETISKVVEYFSPLDDFQFAIPQTPKNIDTFNINSRITPVNLFTNQQSATPVRNAPAGNAGDDNPFTFMFSAENKTLTLRKANGSAISLEEVANLYGLPEGMQVMVDGEDITAKYNLKPQGMDFSGANWQEAKVAPGVLPIDPKSGKFKIELPSFVNLEGKGIIPSLSAGQTVDVAGKYAYLTSWDTGLQIIDLDTFNTVGLYDTPEGGANGIKVSGQYAYIATNNGLKILNISNPQQITLKGEVQIPGKAVVFSLVDDYVYVAASTGGLQIVKIHDEKDPQRINPHIVGFMNTDDKTFDVKIAGDYAYLTENTKGLKILKITNREKPEIIGVLAPPPRERFVSLDVWGKYAYVAASTGGLKIVDISRPQEPKLVGSLRTYNTYNVKILGNYAFVTDWTAGLKVIDISNPKEPQRISSSTTGGTAYYVHIDNDYVYVVNYSGQAGLAPFKATFKSKALANGANIQVNYNF